MRASSVIMSDKRRTRSKRKESENSMEFKVNVNTWRSNHESDDENIEVDECKGEHDCDGSDKMQKETTREKLYEDDVGQTRDKMTSGSLNLKKEKKRLASSSGVKDGNKTVSSQSALCQIFVYFAIPFTVVAIIVFVPSVLPDELRSPLWIDESSTHDKFNYPKIFEDRLKVIRQNVSNQTERFWKILRSRSLAHLRNKKPRQPLVVLLGAPPSAHSVVNCLAKKLAWCLDPELSPSNFIDGSKYNNDEGHKAKKDLDNTLKNIFQKGVRSALVMHLEKLPPPSPLLFYSYCDNDEAPYKYAGIIFTVHLPNELNDSLPPVEAEGSIETFLSDVAWSKYPYEIDSVSTLLSRIADTVALVNHEPDSVVNTVCKNETSE